MSQYVSYIEACSFPYNSSSINLGEKKQKDEAYISLPKRVIRQIFATAIYPKIDYYFLLTCVLVSNCEQRESLGYREYFKI